MLATTVYDVRYKVYDFMYTVYEKGPRGWSESCIRRSLLHPRENFFEYLDLLNEYLDLLNEYQETSPTTIDTSPQVSHPHAPLVFGGVAARVRATPISTSPTNIIS